MTRPNGGGGMGGGTAGNPKPPPKPPAGIADAPWAPCDRCGWIKASGCTCTPGVILDGARHAPHCRCDMCRAERLFAARMRALRSEMRRLRAERAKEKAA